MIRSTKIIATIGPTSQDETTIEGLLKAGVNVARLNFSHGTHEDHAAVMTRLRQVSKKLDHPIAIMQDLQGPKIRTGEITGGKIEIKKGQKLTLTTERCLLPSAISGTEADSGDESVIPIDFPQLLESVRPGNRILLDDGNLELRVKDVKAKHIETEVVLGGILKSHKGVNLPGARINIPGFTDKDEADLKFGLEIGVDAVAVSFVREPNDIHQVREAIKRFAPDRYVPIIAKLEKPEAIKNLEEIIKVADGVMVARGDLGVEMSPERVPITQKCIIEAANRHAKLVITATQMLDSMIHNPRPTRAEASDVANAIFDGTDAVMLSGETASGDYPIQAVEMMNAIAKQAEEHITDWGHWTGKIVPKHEDDDTFYITLAARELAHDRNVAAIAIFTRSGRTALFMSKTRPAVPILAFTPEIDTYHRMNLYWGTKPYLVPHVNSLEGMVEVVEQTIMKWTPLRAGQQVVLICGFPIPAIRPTNLALLHKIGER